MKNKILKPILLVLTAVMFLSAFPVFAFADDGSIELSVISANVSGLPAFLTKYDRDVPKCQATLGKMLNESGYDIICVQEDFQHHDILENEMTAYPYKTYVSGGVPICDGLNIFSKYPFYNIERVTWNEFNGIFTDGADALGPKGFIKCTVDVNGVLIDLYNLHCDAYRTEPDQYAKKAQLIQLSAYMNEHSNGRPIIITGDTNLTFHKDPLSEMYRILIQEGGFTDVWIEMKNGGNYFQGEDGQSLIDAWYKKFGGHDWGRWDSVERVLYKNGDGLTISPSCFEYKIYTDNKEDIKALTDHRIMECRLTLDVSEYQRPNITLKEESKPSFFNQFFRCTRMIFRIAVVLLIGIIQLVFSNIYSAVLFIAVIVSIIYLHIRKARTKKGR